MPTAGVRAVAQPVGQSPPMEAFLISLSTVALAEIGDRTQLLSLVLATQFRKPVAIIAGVLVATLANHLAAGAVGIWFGHYLSPAFLDGLVGLSLMVMALWTLFLPEKLDQDGKPHGRGAFVATVIAFFIAEIGDKTQIATVALAAAYSNLFVVVAGTTLGMLAANVPVVLLGDAFAARLPMQTIRFGSSALFLILGIYFGVRAVHACWPPLSSSCF